MNANVLKYCIMIALVAYYAKWTKAFNLLKPSMPIIKSKPQSEGLFEVTPMSIDEVVLKGIYDLAAIALVEEPCARAKDREQHRLCVKDRVRRERQWHTEILKPQ